jgi:hypothetical protein
MWDFILFGVLFVLIVMSVHMLAGNQVIQISNQREMCDLLREIRDKRCPTKL